MPVDPVDAVGGTVGFGALNVLLLAVPIIFVLGGAVLAGEKLVVVGVLIALVGLAVLVTDLVYGSSERVARSLGGRAASRQDESRLINVVDGLCIAMGVAMPALVVIDTPALNAIVLGKSPTRATLFCTSGLLEALDRIGLEGVIGHELAHIKRGDLVRQNATMRCCAALVALTPKAGRIVARAIGPEREVLADLVGVRATRYPPGLISALEVIAAATTRPPVSPRTAAFTAPLWCATLEEADVASRSGGTIDLAMRLGALSEL